MLRGMNASRDDASRTEIGAHVIVSEPSGILHLTVRGLISEQDAVGIKNAMVEHSKLHPAFSLIAVVTEMTGVDSRARKSFVTPERSYPFGACYVVGASFATRTLIWSIHRARRLLQRNAVTATTLTVESEEEARRMIAAQQQKAIQK